MIDVSLLELFFIFFYVGLFTIGGGLVAITLMEETIVARGLISPEQFYNMVAISESTPGPVGVNIATYIGYELYGVFGAIVTSFVFSGFTSSNSTYLVMVMNKMGIGLTMSCFIVQALTDFCDELVASIITRKLLKSMSSDMKTKIRGTNRL